MQINDDGSFIVKPKLVANKLQLNTQKLASHT
jgi:hypothetical protein